MDSAYLIQVQLGDTQEVMQVFARNQAEMQIVIGRVISTENMIVTVQSLGAASTLAEFLEEHPEDDLNFGCQGDN